MKWRTYERNISQVPMIWRCLNCLVYCSYVQKFTVVAVELCCNFLNLEVIGGLFFHSRCSESLQAVVTIRRILFSTFHTNEKNGESHRTHSDLWIKCYNPKLTFSTTICEYETCYPGTCNSKRSNRPSKPMKMTFLQLFCSLMYFTVYCCLVWRVEVPQSFLRSIMNVVPR